MPTLTILDDQPVFEIRSRDGQHHFKIWANGRTEGFPPETYIINHIPILVHRECIKAEDTAADRAA